MKTSNLDHQPRHRRAGLFFPLAVTFSSFLSLARLSSLYIHESIGNSGSSYFITPSFFLHLTSTILPPYTSTFHSVMYQVTVVLVIMLSDSPYLWVQQPFANHSHRTPLTKQPRHKNGKTVFVINVCCLVSVIATKGKHI